ncbi:MAG: ATP-binding protein [Planctomycetota bacterium]
MKTPDIKPWSQLDNELEEHGGVSGVPRDSGAGGADGLCPSGDTVSSSSGVVKSYMKIDPRWALGPLAASFVWTAWEVVRSLGEDGGIPAVRALGILAFLAAAAMLLVLSIAARKQAMTSLRHAILDSRVRMPLEIEGLPLGEEMRPFYEALEHHTENVERRASEILTEHKQLGLELSLSESHRRKAEAVVSAIPEPILVTDAFDQLVLANPAAAELFDLPAEGVANKPLAELISDHKLVRFIQQVREVDHRAASRTLEHEIGKVTFAVRLSPFVSRTAGAIASDEPHGVVAVFQNVTREREAARHKSEFVAQASHELRTPLSSIRAYVEMLVDGEAADEETRSEYYNIIQSSADRLGRMIDNILNISRIEAGTVRINKEPVAVSMVVKEAIDTARPQADEKRISLTEELTPVMYRVMADRDMIYQATLNLLSNAIKYTPEGGGVEVRMTAHEDDQTICIKVSDTGVGIPKEDLPRMFGKFFRVEANKKIAKGTGLGLNLVKNIVETIHGGKMSLESEEGKGSTFGMTLPMVR